MLVNGILVEDLKKTLEDVVAKRSRLRRCWEPWIGGVEKENWRTREQKNWRCWSYIKLRIKGWDGGLTKCWWKRLSKAFDLIMKDWRNARVEAFCYNDNMKENNLIDFIGELKWFHEYKNIQESNIDSIF